ncbi:hypothetical protein J2Z82_003840 [Virgibacillus litoralis]|uniref:DUF3231 family protein n=1 Tax=Virgibacillus litoralis TaxID=578221 RepID=A0ABS4HIY8_9BACI|nr:DUF3231 family protein [Virgibacillus litoralis]MBP1950868.1 hypothetical protein [Virgibacillus litoralis]
MKLTKEHVPLASSELATLWVIYQKKTMLVRVIDHFLITNKDSEALEILRNFHEKEQDLVNEIKGIFKREGVAVPVAFTENDVNLNAPQLYDDIFDIMYLRMMMKIATGLHALHMTMSYRKDIIDLYKRCSAFSEDYYEKTTTYLLEKGVLPRSPAVTLPNHVAFANDKDYRAGFKFSGNRRVLNTVEVSYIYQGIESNVVGMKLMTGFAQVAQEKDVIKYFFRGKELAKKIISRFGEILMDSDINIPSTSSGRVTDSTISPFSDKLMMYNTSLLSTFGLGSNALGTSFSLRNDLPFKMAMSAKDIFNFASDGGNLMITHGWTEEPPQMEDRGKLSNK